MNSILYFSFLSSRFQPLFIFLIFKGFKAHFGGLADTWSWICKKKLLKKKKRKHMLDVAKID